MRLPDIAGDPRSYGFPPNHPPMHSFLGAPVTARGVVFGNIYLTEKRDGPEFTEDDEAALVVLATQAGVAVENARLVEETRRQHRELQRLSVLEDRERIAKELHDGAIQALFAVGMGLQGSAALAPSEELRDRLQNAVEELDRVIRDLRNYIFGLRPGILADRQLDQALQRLCEEFGQRTAVLEVDDDGRGFDPAAATGTGQGLRNLRERAEGLGGRAEIQSAPGEGTRVRVRIPR
jgi:signal transduction histidine kinase